MCIILLNGLNSLEKHRGEGVLALLGEFALHTRDGGFEEESDKVIISSLSANLLEGRDIGCAIFETDNKQRMVGSKKDEVREQTPSPAIAITERMEILIVSMPFGCNY